MGNTDRITWLPNLDINIILLIQMCDHLFIAGPLKCKHTQNHEEIFLSELFCTIMTPELQRKLLLRTILSLKNSILK